MVDVCIVFVVSNQKEIISISSFIPIGFIKMIHRWDITHRVASSASAVGSTQANNSHLSARCTLLCLATIASQIESARIVLFGQRRRCPRLGFICVYYMVSCFGAVDVSCSSSHVRTNLLKGFWAFSYIQRVGSRSSSNGAELLSKVVIIIITTTTTKGTWRRRRRRRRLSELSWAPLTRTTSPAHVSSE